MRGPDHPWIDSSRAPVYVWRFPGASTDEEVAACCAAREQWAKTARHPCAWVVDLRELLRVPPSQRTIFIEHLKRFEPHDVKWNCGSALVLSNAWLRGIVTAVFAVVPPKFPHRTFASIDEGAKWASEQLKSRT